MEIKEHRDSGRDKWDEYVYGSDFSSFYQLSSWKNVMEKSFDCQTRYLIVAEDQDVRGILPLFIVKSLLFGTSISSMPGGICAENEIAMELLLEKGKEIARQENAKYLKIRDGLYRWNSRIVTEIEHTSIMKLTRDADDLWRRFPPKVRNQVRKAKKLGLKTAMGKRFLPQFYDVFAQNMRDLGTPVLPFRFFEDILEKFASETTILVVKLREEIIAAMLMFFFRDTVADPFASSKREYLSLCPNNLLYWEALKYSCEKGYKKFDMGRSQKGSGTFRFKKQWGAETRDLYYQYYLHKAKETPAGSSGRNSFRLISNTWKKLPLGVANVLGPVIRKSIPFG